MAIRIEGDEDYDLFQCISFTHNRPLKQIPQPTLSVRYKQIYFDDKNRKSWPDTPTKEMFFKDIDASILQRAMAGKPALAEAFVAIQVALAELISEQTGKNCYYEAD